MNRNELIMWIAARGCVRTVDAARRLGIRVGTAQMRLRRLRRRGVLRVVWAGGTAWWCVPGAEPPTAPRVVPRRRERTSEVMQKIDELVGGGCAATAALMKALGLSHTQALYALRLLQAQGRLVEVVVGNVALWCRDRGVAETAVERLRETVHRLAVANNMRYATPTKILNAVQSDEEARAFFRMFVPQSRNAHFSPAALAFVNFILHSLYGEPILRSRRKTVYIVSQPQPLAIDVRSYTDMRVQVELPSDLAEALQGANVDEAVLQALEQLLRRYKA
jgi:uncharacterized protein (DUF2384 family)